MQRPPLVFAIGFLVIGLIGAAIGAAVGWSSWIAVSTAERTEGKVVDLAKVQAPKAAGTKGQPAGKQTALAPVVEYQVAGQTYRIHGHISSPKGGYAVGDTVSVLYPPNNPAEGRIESFAETWLGALVFGGAGLLFTVIGLGMLVWRMRSATATRNNEPEA